MLHSSLMPLFFFDFDNGGTFIDEDGNAALTPKLRSSNGTVEILSDIIDRPPLAFEAIAAEIDRIVSSRAQTWSR